MTWLLIVVVALLGMPLFAVVALLALAGYGRVGLDPALITMAFVRVGDSPLLPALPLLTFSGLMLARSGIPQRLVELGRSVPAWTPGGTIFPALLACVVVAALSGLPAIAMAALGGLCLPALAVDASGRRAEPGMLIAASGLGILFAPALPLVLYTVVAQQVAPRTAISVDAVFLSALLPGLLLLVFLGGWAAWLRRGRHTSPARESRDARLPALRAVAWELPLPFVVMGGLYTGFLLLLEAAVVASIWLTVTVVFMRREVPPSRLPGIIGESMLLVAVLLLLLGLSMALVNLLNDAGVIQWLSEQLSLGDGRGLSFLAGVNLLLLGSGALLGFYATLLVVIPVMLPLVQAFGVDPLQLGAIFMVNLLASRCLSLADGSLVHQREQSAERSAPGWRSALPLLGLVLITLGLVTVWPALSLALPGLLDR